MVDGILKTLGTILYPLFAVIFDFVDLLQAIFRAFAGTGPIGYKGAPGNTVGADNTGAEADSGILYYLMQQTVIKNLILSIFYLALVLLLVFTVMKFLQNIYSDKPKKWQDIIGNAIKGLANFVFLPVCCLLGVWLANVLLIAIDGATSSAGTTTQISKQLFISSAYNANKIRLDAKPISAEKAQEIQKLCDDVMGQGKVTVTIPTDPQGGMDYEYYAQLVDECFAYGGNTYNTIRLQNEVVVGQWYNLIKINYVILVGGGLFMAYVLGSIAFAMVKRLFYLLILFIISPIPCAMYPLNEGSAVGTWKSEFIKNTISAYGAVAGMNLFFSIMPIIQNIDLKSSIMWGGVNIASWSGLLPLVLTIAGLFVVKDVINFVSSLIGADNAYTSGSGLMSSTSKKMKSGMQKTTKGAAATVGAFSKGLSNARVSRAEGKSGAGAFFSSMGGSILGGMKKGGLNLGKSMGLDIESILEAGKGGYDRKGTEAAIAFQKAVVGSDAEVEKEEGNHKGQRFYKDLVGNKVYEGEAGFEAAHAGHVVDVWQKNGGTMDESNPVFKKFLSSQKGKDGNPLTMKEWNGMVQARDEYKTAAEQQKAAEAQFSGLRGAYVQGEKGTEDYNKGVAQQFGFNTDGTGMKGFSQFFKELGFKSVSELSAAVISGVSQFSTDQLNVNSVAEKETGGDRAKAQELVAERQKFNKVQSEYTGAQANFQGANVKVVESAKKMEGSGPLQLDSSTVQDLADKIGKATGENATTTKTAIDATLEALNKVNETLSRSLSKTIKDSAKDIVDEVKKNTSETKSDKK